jgi:putative NADH-flavin reductase
MFVAGATGRTGKALVARAVAAGHRVTAFVRDRAKAAALPGTVAIVEGDILDAAAVAAAVRPEHVIVSTLGGAGPAGPGTALSAGTANLVAAARASGVTRIVALVGAGVLQADATRLRNELPGYPPFLAAIGKEHTAVFHALRDSGLDWTLVCAPDIADADATNTSVVKADYLPDGTGKITTGELAAVILRELEAPAFVRSRVGVNTRAA